MNGLLRLGWRSLTRNHRFSLLFVVNLALGLTGFLLTGSFSVSLERHLATHLQELLTGDLTLQASRPLTDKELRTIATVAGPASRQSAQVALYTMAQARGRAQLTQIVAVDETFPLYGDFRTIEGLPLNRAVAALQQQRQLLLSRETARSLGVGVGEQLRIGHAEYTVAALLDRDPGGDITRLTLAPKVFIGLPQLHETGLIRFGSRISHSHYIALADASETAAIAKRLTSALGELSPKAPEIRVATTLDVNRSIGRIAGYFTSFLGLAALVSLALSGLAAAYLFGEHLRARLGDIAILLSLGANRRQCMLLALGQLAVLGLIAASAAVALTGLLLPLFGHLFTGLVPAGLHITLHLNTAGLALLVGVLGSLTFCLPMSLRILTVRPLVLFREQAAEIPGTDARFASSVAALVPAFVLVFALILQLSQSLLQGLAFTAGLLFLAGCCALVAILLLRGCRRWSATKSLTWRIVWRNLHRNRRAATAAFVALALALALVNLIPQIQYGLSAEIGQPEGMARPDLFLIDIQEEQQQPLIRFVAGEKKILSSLAPMVQGRIVNINGQPFALWRQQHHSDDDRGLRRTEFNFSSRAQLDTSETVIAGPPLPTESWRFESGQPFALSLERGFSERLGVGIGDRMTVDIQGITMEGQIVNLRTVRWNSFQPNFFMLVQPGVLEGAPATYLAAVSGVENDGKDALVNGLAAAFPNISVLDVSQTVERLVRLTGQLTRSLGVMAGLALATGLLTVVAIARQEAQRREQEINLLRVLGASNGTVRTLLGLEFALLAGAAALTGLLLSLVCSWGISQLLFDGLWRYHWQTGSLLLPVTALCSSLTALLAAEGVVRRRPLALLY